MSLFSKKESSYDYYKREYDAYMREKQKKQKKKFSICLLLSLILGIAYLVYLTTTLYDPAIYANSVDSLEQLGVLFGQALVLPHTAAVILAVAFNALGFFFRRRGFALTGAILYAVSIALMPLYCLFVIVQMILSFIGYARMEKPRK